ncbi:multicomponent K+:H+ antiporter subunit A [Desulfomicrobium norvegicum]|uniref:Multicomponent K+:H+ antiporter subunit A n=1 Tax=Desulfomicrobium norvegicum (strain DSM 1741 / NCIMB 8310) TaxID=52561 RepID=A0A8G2C573_DESNO|nr:monovalent cation/H+ antiporter subunit A [Desulfomicrobium norvegicum]SFM07764.1 multicomponent K+:H+ antiporter subunit A [Desulfomicrobium norvegicum]
MNVLLLVLLPLLGAMLPPLTIRFGRDVCTWAGMAVTACTLMLAAVLFIQALEGSPASMHLPWLHGIGLDLSLRMDGLAALFALLVPGIGLLVIIYARYYLSEKDPMGRLHGLLLVFMSSMLGVALSDNLILMLIFWESTSLSSFLLIGFWQHRADARQGARMALIVTGAGGLALLAGFLLLGQMAGTFRISEILAQGDHIRAHSLYVPTLMLILIGAFTKSAQFPFHFWLPKAMAAPTPISAYLHSATMVKAGVFLLARLYPVLSGTDLWFFTVSGVGLTTLLMGAYAAIFQHDLKGLLAYSTISHLGLIVLLFGLDTPLAAVAGVFHIINHATFKASLFMAAGIIDHETGTRDMRRLNGLWKYMPHTAALAMIAAAAMAGVPLLNGFLSKEMFFAETLHVHLLGPAWMLLPAAATLAGIFAVAYSARFIHDVFFNGAPRDLPRFPPHEPPRFMKIPVEILAGACLLVGILPALTVGPLLDLAATSVTGETLPPYSLAIWHGFNTPLLMSLVALGGGFAVYAMRRRLFALHERLPLAPDAAALFNAAEEALIRCARAFLHGLDNGSLQRSAALLLGVAALVMILPLAGPAITGPLPLTPIDGPSLMGALLLMAAGLLTVLWHEHRLSAIMALSVVGLLVALVFVRFSAPDLALTQLSVEVVTIMLLLLALFFIPRRHKPRSRPSGRFRDIVLSTGIGAGCGLLAWGMLTRPLDSISTFFMEQSIPGGGGANVVNVILVDFRGFDTLGEVTVLAVAAVGVFAMLDNLRLPIPAHDQDGRPWAAEPHPLILSQMTRFLLPLALLVSGFLFLRGHNAPGGGFIAGLVTAVALILQYMANGTAWTQRQWRLPFHPLIAVGVLVAAATGAASLLVSHPFLTSTFGHVSLPIVGEFELASAMLFDLGVFLTVVGVIMLILANLGKLTRRKIRPARIR